MIHFLNNKRLVLDVYNGNVRHVHDDSDSNFGTTYVLKEPVSTNNWYNVVASWTGSQMRLYLNGSLVGTQDVSGFSNRDGTDEFGRRGDDGTQVFDDTYFDGEMDDIRLYNRALSLDEVQELYQWGTRGQDLRQVTTTDNTKDMVGWWKLNETDGSTAYDSSGNGVNGTCKNGAGPSGTGTVSSPLGQSAYSLDGIDDEINISGISSPTNVVSFSFWLYPRAVNDGDYDRYLTLEGENGNLYTEIRDEGDGTFHFYLNNSSDNFPEVTHPISNNEWHNWVGVYDGSVQRLYRDGVEVGTNTHDNNGTATVGDNIGSKGGAGFGDIAIDDLRVYSRALTPQEISYLYERKF